MNKKYLLGIFALIILISCSVKAFAEDDDEDEKKSITAKAVDGLIASTPDLAGDVWAMKDMTEDQKVHYVLTQAEDRIKSKIAEKFQDDMKKCMIDYAKKSLRAKAFMDVAVPQIRHAYTVGEQFDWTSLNKKVQEQADNNFNSAMKAIDAAKFTYDVYQTASEKGMLEAFKSVSAQVYDSLASSYIPGWAFFKLGVEGVKFLGNYVIGYATDTAVEGMMNTMYSVKSDPEGFAKWVLDKSPSAISKDIDDKWELVSSGFVYEGQGTDAGDEAMKKRLLTAVMDIRMGVVQKAKELQKQEEQVKRDAEQYLRPAKDAEQKIRDVADKAKKEADDSLAKVRDFKAKYFGLKKQDMRAEFQEKETELEKQENARKSTSGSAIVYEPINRGAILDALRNALEEIKDSGTDGYDAQNVAEKYKDYQKVRQEAINASNKSNAEKTAAANKTLEQINAAYAPQEAQASARYYSAKTEGERQAASAEMQRIQEAHSAAGRPYYNAQYILRDAQGKDLKEIAFEENMIILEANERAAKLSEAILNGLEEIKTKIDKAAAEFNDAIAILNQEKSAELKYPDAWRNPGYYDGVIKYNWYIQQPADLQKQLRFYEEAKNNLLNDEKYIPELQKKEKEIYAEYIDTAKEAVSDFKRLVPAALVPKEMGEMVKEGKDTGSESLEFVLQAPWGFYTPIGNIIKDMREKGIAIFRLWYPHLPFDEQLKLINKPPIADISKVMAELTKRIDEAQDLAHLAELTSLYYSIHNRIFSDRISIKIIETTLEQEKQRARDLFPLEGGGSVMYILPEASEGAGYLKQLKTFWENNQGNIEKLKNLRRQIGNNLDQYFGLSKNYYPTLDKLDNIPERIKLYEQNFEQAKKDYNRRVDISEKYYNEAVAEFNQVVKEQFFSYEDKVKRLKKVGDKAKSYAQLYKSWKQDDRLAKIAVLWQKLSDDLAKAIAEAQAQGKRSDDERKRQWQEQEQARQEAERKKQEEARKIEEGKKRQEQESKDRARTTPGGLAGLYGYSLMNARMNTYSLNSASGDVVVMRSDLRQGGIEITARLTNLEKVDKILISEDDGRTWKELSRSQDISHSFVPLPDKLYQPILRIKTVDSEDVQIKIFPNINGIVYKDIDSNQLIAETVKKIAEAYETRNLGLFSQYISRDYLGNKTFLEEGVRFDFDMFIDIKLTIYINRIDKRGTVSAAEIKWDKIQVPRTTNQQQNTSGNTTMMFVFEDGKMKIQNLRGNLIYATLSPEIAQASGLSSAIVEQIRVAENNRNPVQPGAGETEQSGGTSSSNIESGTFNLTQNDAHAAVGWIQEFSFTNNQVYTIDAVFGPVYDFRRREGFVEVRDGNGIQDLGMVDINSVTEAPASGYATSDSPVVSHTYALQLADGTYALVQITALGDPPFPTTSTFRYKHQKDGTRNFN